MKLSRKALPSGDIDVTSFADLAFLLIIFFILTTTFTRPMGARTTIPSSTSNPENKPEEELPIINLSQDQMLLNEDKVTIEELRTRLMAMQLPKKPEKQRIIILESAADVPFERYFKVVTAISRAGGVLAIVENPVEDEKQ